MLTCALIIDFCTYTIETQILCTSPYCVYYLKIVSEYGQEIPQSQTTDNPWHHEEEPFKHHETAGRQIKQSNQLSLPHQDDCNTRIDIK